MSPDPVSWPIYILILLIVMVSNGLVSAALNALDSVDRNKLNEISLSRQAVYVFDVHRCYRDI